MTLRELQSEICSLGFDQCAKLDISLLYAVRRALAEISREARIIRKIRLFISFPRPSSTVNIIRHTGGRTELLPLKGSAYSLCASGKGKLTVFDGKVKRSISFDAKGKTVKGLLYGDGSLELSGECSYVIFCLTLYSEPYFADADDIPDPTDTNSVDMADRVADFLGFTGEITDGEGRSLTEVRLLGTKMFFREGFCGEVILPYYRNLTVPDLSAPDEPVDIPREYETLLPLLSASYILLDRDPEKAEYYRDAYQRALSEIKHKGVSGISNGYISVNGWA